MPSADDYAELTTTVNEDLLRISQKMKFQGEDLEIPVLELEFTGQEICSDELKALVQETPKERRLKRELDPEFLKRSIKMRRKTVSSRLMIKRALAAFSPEIHQGLQLDLQKFTRQEVMSKLKASGAGGHKRKKVQQVKKLTAKNKIKHKVFKLRRMLR